MDDQGIITLTNRPLTRQVRDLESQGITSNIKRTYSAVSSYVHDILDDHNLCLSYTPNSIFSDEDGLSQMAALTVMRSIPRHFISREYDSGPFIMTLTDINPGNIFVDDKWNVTGIVDLEWTCSLPAEFIHPPHWMTGKTEANILIDAEFVQRHQEFKDLYEAEEASMHSTYRIGIPSLDKRTLFYCLALFHTVHLYQIFHCHIKPLYLDELNEDEEREGLCKFMAPFWGRDVANTINCKVAERESYILQVKEHFRTQLEEKRIRSG
ncbi:MAG: hypothetical protein M1818_004560 [Claussenomyces sp. TS43310]|nr:MAG: hypothetical protein M1818_004560 [Claussenomyces sp. TS43310]